MSARKDRRRKQYFIKGSFQTKFILRFCGLVILGTVISGLILFFYLFFRSTVTTAFVNSRLSIINTTDYILPVLIGAGLITIILITIATALVMMYLSHRIAGPLFKIEKSIGEIGAGDLTLKINLRSTDEIQRTADSFNDMVENLKENLLKIKTRSKSLGSQIDNLKALSQGNEFSSQQMQDTLKELSRKKEELDRAIECFKT